MRWTSIALPLLLLGFPFFPQTAEACACCDATIERRVLGWSKSGYSALVETETIQGCERTVALEVWRPDTEGPHHCLDLLGDPDKRVECGALNFNHNKQPKSSALEGLYPTAPLLVAPDQLRATLEIGVGKDEAKNTLLRVFIWQGGWFQIYEGFLALGWPDGDGYDAESRDKEEEVSARLVRISLLPSPEGNRGLLLVAGHNLSPGSGLWGGALHWVSLSKTTRGSLQGDVLFSSGRTGPGTRAVPLKRGVRARLYPEAEKQHALVFNASGLKLLRAGERQAAVDQFVHALSFDPGHVLARYNLACSLALLGHQQRALAQLETLFELCGDCQARRDKARSDEDLQSLHELDAFGKLVCRGDTSCRRALQTSTAKASDSRARASSPPQPRPAEVLGKVSSPKSLGSQCRCGQVGHPANGSLFDWALLVVLFIGAIRRGARVPW